MIKNIFHWLFGSKRRFRHMTFDELSELYISMMLRSLAMSMAGIFIPIYLYQHGYKVWQIFIFFAVIYLVQTIFCIPVAYLIARIGPKHTLLFSYLLQIITMTAFFYIENIPSLYILSVVFGVALITFFMAFHIDFSKVKHSKKGGSELGFLFIMERTGLVLGPIIGGLIAYKFSPKFTFAFAMILLLVAVVPLMMTKEPTRTHQILDFSGVKIKSVKFDLVSYIGIMIDTSVSNIVWALFVGVIIFADNQYLKLGSISSIAMVVSVLSAKAIGKLVDNRKGRLLLRFSAAANTFVHLARPFISGYAPTLAVNLLNESVTSGYRMPFTKGFYDAADDHPGSRIVYVTIVEITAKIAGTFFFIFAATLAYFMPLNRMMFGILFFVAGLASLMIMLERFPALNNGKKRS